MVTIFYNSNKKTTVTKCISSFYVRVQNFPSLEAIIKSGKYSFLIHFNLKNPYLKCFYYDPIKKV